MSLDGFITIIARFTNNNDMETIMSNQTYVKTSSRNTSSKVREVLHKCHCLPRIYTQTYIQQLHRHQGTIRSHLSLSLLSSVLYIAIDNSAHSVATTANLCAYTHIGMHQFFACLARHCSLWLSEKSYHCIPKCFFINSRAKYCDDDVEMLLHGRKNEGNKKKERKKKKMKQTKQKETSF